MAKLYNLARMTTATTGTGTITLGSAVASYLTFAAAGIANGDTVTYAIVDGNNREIGRGVYSSTGPTLTRSVLKSTNANAAISLSGSAEVFITPAAEDIAPTYGLFWENDTTIASNVTLTAGVNSGTFGPITINSGVTVTVPSTSTWTIV